jgi:hypothetical protein
MPPEHGQSSTGMRAAKQELVAAKEELARQRTANSVLRRVMVELSLELEQAKDELAATSAVTRLPVAQDNNSGLTGPC